MKKIISLIAALVVSFSTSSISFAAELQEVPKEKMAYVYIGDSRTVGLNNVCKMSLQDDTFVIAAVGKGYNWWIKDGITEFTTVP